MTARPDCTRRDLFVFIRLTMCVAAMHPMRLGRYLPNFLANMLGLSCELFLYFVSVHIAVLYVCTLYFSYGQGDLEFLVNCLIQTIIYFWTIAMKLYFRRGKPNLLRDLIDFINLEYRTRSAKGFTYVTMNESLAQSTRWIKVYVYCCFVGTIFWLVLPIVYQDHSLPLACWYPFDYGQPLLYAALYALQSIGQIQVAAAFSASSGFHMVLAILLSGQYDVLNCSLKNVVATASLEAGAPPEELQKIKIAQAIADLEPNQYYCAVEHETAISELITDHRSSEQENFLVTFKNAFRACVNHHHYINEALNRMERFYNPIWFFKIGEVTFLMCLVAFVSVKSTTANSFMRMVSLGQYLLLVLWELLIICYFAELIYQNSQRCGEALLRSPWHLHMHEMRSDFLLFLLNSKRHFQLSAGKIYNLNVDRFRGTITTAFSFLTLLQKMDVRV